MMGYNELSVQKRLHGERRYELEYGHGWRMLVIHRYDPRLAEYSLVMIIS
jgi:hypothetical protein